MNADQRRWMRLATTAAIFAGISQGQCTAAELMPSSDRKPAQGVVEYADEFAHAELSRKPSYHWTLPFTQYVSPPVSEVMHGALMFRREPAVRLDEERTPSGMKPTPLELLIQCGLTSGERQTSNNSNLIVHRPRRVLPPPQASLIDDSELLTAEAKQPLIESSLNFSKFIASGEAYRFSHSGWPTSKKYPRWVRIDDEDPSLAMKPTTVELLIERGFPLGNWHSHSFRFRVSPPDKPNTSNHLATPTNAIGFTYGGFSR